MSRPITIGNYCWIANRCTIAHGSVLPDYTIVASNSLINKDYSSVGSYSLLAGIPGKLIKENVKQVFNSSFEKELMIKEFGHVQ